MRRNHWHVGDYLMVDQLSGLIRYASQIQPDWDGTYRVLTDLDGKHPDLVKKPMIREAAPPFISPAALVTAYANFRPRFIGSTSVLTPVSPADHLFSVSAQ